MSEQQTQTPESTPAQSSNLPAWILKSVAGIADIAKAGYNAVKDFSVAAYDFTKEIIKPLAKPVLGVTSASLVIALIAGLFGDKAPVASAQQVGDTNHLGLIASIVEGDPNSIHVNADLNFCNFGIRNGFRGYEDFELTRLDGSVVFRTPSVQVNYDSATCGTSFGHEFTGAEDNGTYIMRANLYNPDRLLQLTATTAYTILFTGCEANLRTHSGQSATWTRTQLNLFTQNPNPTIYYGTGSEINPTVSTSGVYGFTSDNPSLNAGFKDFWFVNYRCNTVTPTPLPRTNLVPRGYLPAVSVSREQIYYNSGAGN